MTILSGPQRGGEMTSDTILEPMLTVREVAQILHMHSNTVRRWADRGVIRAYRISYRGDRRFRRDDVTRLRDQLQAHNGNDKEAFPDW